MLLLLPACLLSAAEPSDAAGYELAVSTSAARTDARPLEGATVSGKVYVFARPETGATQARFWLDNPAMTGTPSTTERNPPWDFAGGNSNGTAKPFDTATRSDGSHTISVALDLSGGGVATSTAAFTIRNTSAARLAFGRSGVPFAASGGTVARKTVGLSALDGGAVDAVLTDDASWLTAMPSPARTPHDVELTVDPTGLAPGTYRATVTASAPGYVAGTLPVTLVKRDSLEPDQLHLAWVADTATTLTIVWRTWDPDTPSRVRFRRSGDTAWQERSGGLRPSGAIGSLREVGLTGLAPATRYEYAVQADNGSWSQTYETRTAPPPGPADFDVVYVADTGLIGRTDGLATGTRQVRDEIDAMDPLAVLLGGDYAYFNTDKRYGTLDNTIDAWFNQMQPIGSGAPMQVAYGNHEILLGEGFDPWARRFPTPPGFDGRRNHSFDVGDVHFISLFAVSDTAGLPSATLSWLQQDMAAARARGQRWIVPFFHVSPFADGSSHPSNFALRSQLGPLFERNGVKLALASHDQSYERTFPLTGVPATNTTTSRSRTCYTAADGVTYAKVSPGGKLSNKNGDFSKFQTIPAPDYTAVRNDTLHHFARLTVSSGGTLRLRAYGVVGDGTPPVLVDDFQYTLGACPPELAFSPATVAAAAERGGPAVIRTVRLTTNSGTSPDAELSDDAAWLTAEPASRSVPGDVTLTLDPTGLEPGIHRATVMAMAAGTRTALLPVTLTVNEGPSLLVSTAPDRSGSRPLAAATVSGNAYVFALPESGVTQVRFWLDNPTMSGTPLKVERNAPWDFAGTAADRGALPWLTSSVADGPHSITAAIDLSTGGTRVVRSSFTVDNPP